MRIRRRIIDDLAYVTFFYKPDTVLFVYPTLISKGKYCRVCVGPGPHFLLPELKRIIHAIFANLWPNPVGGDPFVGNGVRETDATFIFGPSLRPDHCPLSGSNVYAPVCRALREADHVTCYR